MLALKPNNKNNAIQTANRNHHYQQLALWGHGGRGAQRSIRPATSEWVHNHNIKTNTRIQHRAQDEITEMKRKFKVMTRQIDQLKEEIQKKDNGLVSRGSRDAFL